MKLIAARAGSVGLIELIAATALAGIIYLATLPAVLETVPVGKFMSFIVAKMLLLPSIKRLTTVMPMVQRGVAAAESIFGLLDAEAEKGSGTRRLGKARGEVEFRQVSFAYDAGKGDVLKDIDLHIEPGQCAAFVGRSGSGKSTLVSLLPRLYDVERGTILLDGVDIRELALRELRDHIAWVGQDVVLFNDTIARNIAYGALGDVSEEAIVRAAEAAHAMEFIRRLPEGLDTLVGENGMLLSGGQRQRLAIARALLKDAPILILDEATSALDSESERHIQAALAEVIRNLTSLVIAHRLSTIENADQIVVMDHGRIVEQGRHRELLARGGYYAKQHQLQFPLDSKAGVVSRGYGGTPAEYARAVTAASDPREVGDEPVLIALRAGCPVVVDANRVRAANNLLTTHECDVIVADDGLQHYALARDVEIAVVDAVRRHGNGRCLPAGPLREPLARLAAVDLVMLNGGGADDECGFALRGEQGHSFDAAQAPRALTEFAGRRVQAGAAIGRPARFFEHLRARGVQVIEHAFPDHYAYVAADIRFGDGLPVLMPEKDAVKCRGFTDALHGYLPVRAELEAVCDW